MPTYQYKCSACEHEFEIMQSITASVKKKCPKCKKMKLKRLIGSGSALLFKGSGFHCTDYRSDNYIIIYPNPTTGKFTISSRQGTIKKVEVYDLFGRKVLTTTLPEIDMRGYAKGVYFVRVGEVVRKLVLH